ncbi:hypothetical protein GIB67_033390 [Kingdonia uniflora]|uniref:Uncharacterized protein n=1 Tax=Kingdonia uniflora TaxID=39325 RepID=A0A7J7LTN8_9MAGN|nr:hypothetical protein GIB67_033390 [Kingdonia uniflora]
MGQSMMKLANGAAEGKKAKDIGPIVEEYYNANIAENSKDWKSTDFYQAVCEIVEEVNKNIDGTQLRVPNRNVLEKAFNDHREGKTKSLTKEEFGKILKDVIFDAGFIGTGSKDIILYIYGVPAISLFIKQLLIPTVIPNDVFIPGVTAATVFLLAKLNKI